MEIILLLITSGIPGFYTYYSLSNKNKIYFDSDNKNVILSFFSTISIMIFLFLISLFSGINNVTELINNLTFTKIFLSLITSIIIVVILTEFAYPKVLNFYNNLNNIDRNKEGLNDTEKLPIHLSIYENKQWKLFIIVKDFENNIIEKGFLDNYSRKGNRNILLDTRFNDKSSNLIEASSKKEIYVDFENNVKLEYYYFEKDKVT